MERVRIGVIGSRFAARLHLESVAKLRGVKADIVAAPRRTATTPRSCAKAFDIPECCDDYRRLLERKDIDCVDLCIPTDLHAAFCVEAARAGKHVTARSPLPAISGRNRWRSWWDSPSARS